MGLNFDFIVKYLPWYVDAAILTVRIAFFGILLSLIIGIACSVVQYYRIPIICNIIIFVKGTTAETYFEKNYPDVKLQKYDEYADAHNALLDECGNAFSTDNTEVLAWAIQNPGFTVDIDALGDADTNAPAVAKGNTALLEWINDEIEALGRENFFHADYEATLADVYGDAANPDNLVVEGGKAD